MGDSNNIYLGIHSGESHNVVAVELGGESTMGVLIDYVSGHFPIVALAYFNFLCRILFGMGNTRIYESIEND